MEVLFVKRFAKYIDLAKNLSPGEMIDVIMWYLHLRDSVKVNIRGCELTLDENIGRKEGLWYLLTLLQARKENIKVKVSKGKIYIDILGIDLSLDHYGFLILNRIVKLHKFGAKLRGNVAR